MAKCDGVRALESAKPTTSYGSEMDREACIGTEVCLFLARVGCLRALKAGVRDTKPRVAG